MKKILYAVFTVLLLQTVAFAQDESQVDLRDKSVRFFVHSMHLFDAKQDNIIPAFRKSKNKQIVYWYNNQDLDLATQLFEMQKLNPVWRNAENSLLFVNKKLEAGYPISMLADSTQKDKVMPENITVSVFNTMYDSEYAYVVLWFKSAGPMEAFYTGELVCKYDKKGNLVKYSYLEK